MAIVLDSLKKSLDNIALLVKLSIEVVLNLEIAFVWNTSNGSMLLKVGTLVFLQTKILFLPIARRLNPCGKMNLT